VAENFDLESPRAPPGGCCGSGMAEGVADNKFIAIWYYKNCTLAHQCTREVPPRPYFAQQYFLARGNCMGVSGGIILF
jgi:hypothetical protein